MRYSAEDHERFASTISERELKNKERRAFDSADQDADGYINKDELVVLLKILGEPSHNQLVDELFNNADHDKDNFITFE